MSPTPVINRASKVKLDDWKSVHKVLWTKPTKTTHVNQLPIKRKAAINNAITWLLVNFSVQTFIKGLLYARVIDLDPLNARNRCASTHRHHMCCVQLWERLGPNYDTIMIRKQTHVYELRVEIRLFFCWTASRKRGGLALWVSQMTGMQLKAYKKIFADHANIFPPPFCISGGILPTVPEVFQLSMNLRTEK